MGEIDGKSVSYNDFQVEVDRFTTINEITTGSSVQNEQQQIAVRNAAWQALVDQYLVLKNAKKAGFDAIHDTVHEMAKDEARHGKGFEGLYNRYFKK